MGQVLERGDLQFFFRPTVQPAELGPEGTKLAVQSFFAILSPAGGERHRRLRVGKKRMPANGRERFWARIEKVGSLQRVLGATLEGDVYTTKTRGERYQPAARPVATGSYEIIQHDDHVRLHYQVDPLGFEDAPEELGVLEEGSPMILFENAGGRATWTMTGGPDRLDEEGAEIVLVGSQHQG